jgi:glycosyltransferase involved in cell wall biosynthesis
MDTSETNNRLSLSVLTLTYNEEANLPYLLESLAGWVQTIYIVDSGSTDRTLQIAKNYGAEVVYHEWVNQAEQFNWGLSHFDIHTDWVMRMDADEIVMPQLAQELCTVLPTLPPEITGLYVKRRVHFMGRWIRHGSYYPTWLLRIFRTHKGYCENRWMDEHIVLTEGKTQQLQHDIIDENHKGLSFWLSKHDNYAKRELRVFLSHDDTDQGALFGAQYARKRWMKGNIYQRAPLFWRAWFYFIYRYVFRLGFLDGREGLVFHVLQGFWYRFYVDALLLESQQSNHKTDHQQSL